MCFKTHLFALCHTLFENVRDADIIGGLKARDEKRA
jgi:hypothetical protein